MSSVGLFRGKDSKQLWVLLSVISKEEERYNFLFSLVILVMWLDYVLSWFSVKTLFYILYLLSPDILLSLIVTCDSAGCRNITIGVAFLEKDPQSSGVLILLTLVVGKGGRCRLWGKTANRCASRLKDQLWWSGQSPPTFISAVLVQCFSVPVTLKDK